jgi:hypothetical protein
MALEVGGLGKIAKRGDWLSPRFRPEVGGISAVLRPRVSKDNRERDAVRGQMLGSALPVVRTRAENSKLFWCAARLLFSPSGLLREIRMF